LQWFLLHNPSHDFAKTAIKVMTKLQGTPGWHTQVDHVVDLKALSAHHIVAST
jgi:hypothetical protein